MPDPTPAREQCMVLAHQEMCVDADVRVVPFIHAGPITTRCVGAVDLRPCGVWGDGDAAAQGPAPGGDRCGPPRPKSCCFSIRQVICVTIPLVFDAAVESTVSGVECATPKPGPCPR